jgi:hypothetical protein
MNIFRVFISLSPLSYPRRYTELQKAVMQGQRHMWRKISVLETNCAIEVRTWRIFFFFAQTQRAQHCDYIF